MNAPECDKLRDAYNNCFNQYLKKPLTEFQTGIFECNNVFNDYKDCVEIIMKKMIEEKKKGNK